MRANENYATKPSRPPWKAYGDFEEILNVVLDDSFKDPHIHVYEHSRHTFEETFLHKPSEEFNQLPDSVLKTAAESLAIEETSILQVLKAPERPRLLRIVGDVGVGKSTFLRHLASVHFSTTEFGGVRPLYLDWKGFSARDQTALEEIRKWFANKLFKQFEENFSLDALLQLDDRAFEADDLFATSRAILQRTPLDERPIRRNEIIADKHKEEAWEVGLARLRTLGTEQSMAAVIIFDNIDQLSEIVLGELFRFAINIQNNNPFLVITALRDHTSGRFSAYEKHAIQPGWLMRLQPPNLRLTIERRLEYFFPVHFDATRHGNFIVANAEHARKVCRALLASPFVDDDTYDFLMKWSNFSVRMFFAYTTRILSYAGLDLVGVNVLMGNPTRIRPDMAIMALALGNRLVFSPKESSVYNPYASQVANPKLDCVIGVRFLQFLFIQSEPVQYETVRQHFERWGYPVATLDAEVQAMLRKDVIWADSGPPDDFTRSSYVRLSYKGRLHISYLLPRAIYNYFMSFDVNVPKTSLLAQSKPQEELKFADLKEPLDAERLIRRVIELAKLIKEAEEEELSTLRSLKVIEDFRVRVRPSGISLGIIRGLTQYVNAIHEERESISRKAIMPPTSWLTDISELQIALAHLAKEIGGHEERQF